MNARKMIMIGERWLPSTREKLKQLLHELSPEQSQLLEDVLFEVVVWELSHLAEGLKEHHEQKQQLMH